MTTRNGSEIVAQTGGGALVMDMTPKGVMEQLIQIQNLMKVAMVLDVHYGKIPGCGDKPALLKPGADKLNLMFRLAPTFNVDVIDLGDGHREYRVTCRIVHAPSGTFLGEGVGAAATTETKWAYRWENTGREVPKEYWDNGRNPMLLGGTDYVARKVWEGADGQRKQVWIIHHRVAHENPADYYNTVLKMAKKRAHVDGVLTVTAASDIFDQDIEDLVENGVSEGTEPVRTPRSTNQTQTSEPRKPVTQPSASSPGSVGAPALDASPQTAQEQAAWIVQAMHYVSEGDDTLAHECLREWSEFVGSDNQKRSITSRSELVKKSPKWIASTYSMAKKAVAAKIEIMNASSAAGDQGAEQENLPLTGNEGK